MYETRIQKRGGYMSKYISTRGDKQVLTASEAILKGLASDGGLYVPVEFPSLDMNLGELLKLDYKGLAYEVMKVFLGDFSKNELVGCINNAYDDNFNDPLIAPVKKVGDVGVLELFHGPTLAFKDMALTILPHLMTTSMKKQGVKDKIVIMTATSGDTGKAALEGFADVEGTEIVVFYPKDGVSKVQELQMVTQKGDNTHVVGIDGNFDDAQTGVKEIFENVEFNNGLGERGYKLSSANSINIGRLLPQVVYYFYAYKQFIDMNEIENGEKVNFVVPTGNYGNILAGYWAKKLGLPINKLICASNDNKILTDFIKIGEYDIRREFKKTISPSMDILISSNLERLLRELSSEEFVANAIGNLKKLGSYKIDEEMHGRLTEHFYGGYCNEFETLKAIEKVKEENDYIMDTHTGVAYRVYQTYKEQSKDETKSIVVSTASPFKFAESVLEALKIDKDDISGAEFIYRLADKTEMDIPTSINGIESYEIRHNTNIATDKMKDIVNTILG